MDYAAFFASAGTAITGLHDDLRSQGSGPLGEGDGEKRAEQGDACHGGPRGGEDQVCRNKADQESPRTGGQGAGGGGECEFAAESVRVCRHGRFRDHDRTLGV